jgi:hypothetical protein
LRLSTQRVIRPITAVELLKQSFEVVQVPGHDDFKPSANKHAFMLANGQGSQMTNQERIDAEQQHINWRLVIANSAPVCHQTFISKA